MKNINHNEHPVLLFDGVCNLCNDSVQFIIKNDPKGIFRFAALQSKAGQAYLRQYNLPNNLKTVVLIDNGKVYTRSDAPLRVCSYLEGAWSLLFPLIFIPRFIRDAVYNWIARNRYHWFGRQESCLMPTPDLQRRFL